jgi:hypothetical protein
MFREGIVSRTERHVHVERVAAASLVVSDRSWFILPDEVYRPRLTLQCNGRSETELRAKALPGRASGLNGQIPLHLTPATANISVADFIQASVNNFGNLSWRVPLPGFSLLNCPEHHSSNVSEDWVELFPSGWNSWLQLL